MPQTIVIMLFVLSIAFTTTPTSAQQPNQSNANVPDVMIVVVSGVLPFDGISYTYNSAVEKSVAEADLRTILEETKWQAGDIEISTSGTPQMTSVEFTVNGAVDWSKGALYIEPFVLAFKRYDLIQINYGLPGTFPFRSLRDYNDKHVDIKWSSGNTAHSYTIRIKDHNFERLNLPLTVEPPGESADEESTSAQARGGGRTIWLGLMIALIAGVIVFVIVSRKTQR